jgi:hypothetical protein
LPQKVSYKAVGALFLGGIADAGYEIEIRFEQSLFSFNFAAKLHLKLD